MLIQLPGIRIKDTLFASAMKEQSFEFAQTHKHAFKCKTCGFRRYSMPHTFSTMNQSSAFDKQEVNIRLISRNEEQEKSQFVDTLLLGILQMLLGGGANAMVPPPSTTPVPPPEVRSPEEEFEAPATTAAPLVNKQPTTQLSGMSPESMIATALNAQQNQMGALNKQVALLEKEIKAWQKMRAEEAEAGPENAIHLSIKYPGQAANETNAAAQAEEAEKLAEEEQKKMKEEVVDVTGGDKVDPTKLSVPLIVVSPKMADDFHSILLKTVKQASEKGKNAQLVAQMQKSIQDDPNERLEINRRLLKEAQSHKAFFTEDENLTLEQMEAFEPKHKRHK